MRMEHRLQNLELKFVTTQPGCNVELFIVVPEDLKNEVFDFDSFRPSIVEIEIFLNKLKDAGQCQDCKGSCAVDWSPEGFNNQSIGGERISSSPGPNIFWMFCADAEIPQLCRRIMNGEREPASEGSK